LPDFGYLREDLPIGDRNDPGRKIKEKMRRTILLFVTLFTAMEIYAQSGSVTATVIDASTREGVPGAVRGVCAGGSCGAETLLHDGVQGARRGDGSLRYLQGFRFVSGLRNA